MFTNCLSGVLPNNKEVETGTDVTISCVITGITKKLDTVVWTKEGIAVTTLSLSNYVVSEGIYGSNSQTTKLTVKAAANTADSIYTCTIKSDEWNVEAKQTTVILNSYGGIFFLIEHV
jgi:hypothetical protein